VNPIVALMIVGGLWIAITRLLANSLGHDAEPSTAARRHPRIVTWHQIPTNRPTAAFPDSRAAVRPPRT